MKRSVERPQARVGPWVALSLAYPWIWLSSVYATWLVARVSLGRSPRPLLDDPKLLGAAVSSAHSLAVLLLMLLMPSGVLTVAAALWLGWSGRLSWHTVGSWLSALLLSWFAAALYGGLDPGRVLAWFVD